MASARGRAGSIVSMRCASSTVTPCASCRGACAKAGAAPADSAITSIEARIVVPRIAVPRRFSSPHFAKIPGPAQASRPGEPMPQNAISEFALDPPDTERLANLAGPFDAHLRLLELRLGVEIGNRGN